MKNQKTKQNKKEDKLDIGIVPFIFVGNMVKYLLVKTEEGVWEFPKIYSNINKKDIQKLKEEFHSETMGALKEFEFEHIIYFNERNTKTKYYLSNYYNKKLDLCNLGYKTMKLCDYNEAKKLLSESNNANILIFAHNLLNKRDLS